MMKMIWKLCVHRLHCWEGHSDGRPDSDFDNSQKKRCYSPLTRRDDREAQIDDLVDELREMHSEDHDYTLNHNIDYGQGWFKMEYIPARIVLLNSR